MEAFANYHDKDSAGHPTVDGSKLTIYGNIICPFVRRVLLILAEKKVAYNFIGIDLQNKPKWYLDMYPPGKVPYLKDGEKTLPESMVIANYLDSIYPPTIHPADPYEKAKGLLLIDELMASLLTQYRCVKDPSLSPEDKIKVLNEMFINIESIIARMKTRYFQGNDKPSFADYMVWPFLEMTILMSRRYSHPTIHSIDSLSSTYPFTGKYMKLMSDNQIIQQGSLNANTFDAYFNKVYGVETY